MESDEIKIIFSSIGPLPDEVLEEAKIMQKNLEDIFGRLNAPSEDDDMPNPPDKRNFRELIRFIRDIIAMMGGRGEAAIRQLNTLLDAPPKSPIEVDELIQFIRAMLLFVEPLENAIDTIRCMTNTFITTLLVPISIGQILTHEFFLDTIHDEIENDED